MRNFLIGGALLLSIVWGGGTSVAWAREINTAEVKRCAEDAMLGYLALEGFRQQSPETVLLLAAAMEAKGGINSKEDVVEKLKEMLSEKITITCLDVTNVREITPDQYRARATFQVLIDSDDEYSRQVMAGTITVTFVRNAMSVTIDPKSMESVGAGN